MQFFGFVLKKRKITSWIISKVLTNGLNFLLYMSAIMDVLITLLLTGLGWTCYCFIHVSAL